ncbi:MAG: GH3 auxin-responsive promoter family protein [Planctomycetes bacterium]|nr:GH3 auxin-responsive promoter family protein [Planctomycetota bacterium]
MRRVARDPFAVQERLLQRLLARARHTEFGREHRFDRVSGSDEYRRCVPLRGYTELAPYWQRARDGACDVTWPGFVRDWALSSGTTAGEKFLPVSTATIRTNKRGGFDALVPFLAHDARPLFEGKLLFLGGSTALREVGESRIGDNTGIMQREIPAFFRRMHVPSRGVASLTDWEQKIAAAGTECLGADVRLLSGVPSWILLFCERVLALARERDPNATLRDVWPRLACFVHGGVGFAPYRARFERLLGTSITTIDTFSASEGGMLGVQDQPGSCAMLPLADLGTFFEFVPVEELESSSPTRLRLAEVDTGVLYALVLTTNSGIWSYILGDIVRFESRDPLRFVFAGRIAHTLNAFGEHVSSGELDRAVAAASAQCAVELVEFAVATRYPSETDPIGQHVYFCEFEGASPDEDGFEDRFTAAIDATLQAGNEDYATHRTYGLRAPALSIVPSGGFEAWMARRGKIGGQNKVPRVLTLEAASELFNTRLPLGVTE